MARLQFTKGEMQMFQVDPLSRVPVYEQLVEQVENYVLTDILGPNSQLPSVRSLSISLSVNPNTIQKAIIELDRRGLVYSVPGKGCFISENAKEILSLSKQNRLSELIEIATELKLAGVEKDILLNHIEQVYSNSKGVTEND